MEVSEALYVELKRLEALEPTPEAKSRGGMNTKSLYCPNVVEHPRNRIRIRYISYQADSILELDEARDYLKFLRNLETFEGFHGHFHYKKYL